MTMAAGPQRATDKCNDLLGRTRTTVKIKGEREGPLEADIVTGGGCGVLHISSFRRLECSEQNS